MANKRVFRIWLLSFVALLTLFILLQVPASWLLNKFAPNLRMLHNVNGNIWHGQADWQVNQLKGTVHWTTRPWEMIRLRAAANITIHSGQTQLTGAIGYGLGKTIYIDGLNGKVSPDTLAQLMAWQWPSTSINVQDLALEYKKEQGFIDADGQLTWAGGTLQYLIAQRQERIDVPPLVARLSAAQNKLNLSVKDTQQQNMADLTLGADHMLDIQITQRFLLNAPSYKGQAGMDTAVITTRQPLHSLGGM